MTRPILHTVEHVGLDEILTRLEESTYDESSQALDQRPEFRFVVKNEGGVNAHVITNGDEIYIRRNNERRFHGIVTTPTAEDGDSRRLIVEGVQFGYKLLQARQCDSYDFDEDGDPATTRDAVTVNPWRYRILRDPDGALDANGNGPALDGVLFDDVLRCLIGVKFITQLDLVDNSFLLASQVASTSNAVQVYKDGTTGDIRPKLQRVRDGSGFKAGGSVESIPLHNGDPNIEEMGDISTVSVLFVGEYDGTNDITVEVCRNASEGTRTYSSVSLTRTDSWQGTTFSAWEGSVDLSSDGATEKSKLAFKVTIPGNAGDADTTKVVYARLDADTVSDTGVTEGTMATYSNPVAFGDNGEDYVEGDLLGFTRLQAAEKVRKLTESDLAVNSSAHWDAWIDHDEAFHFAERRGSDLGNIEYTRESGLVNLVSHEYYGDELAFQTIALGAGSGTAQTRIVSKAEFDGGGGLYDSDRDPDGGTQLYGKLPRVMRFVDQNETSATNLFRKARAFHKLHRDPKESFELDLVAEYVPYFNVGDGITVKNLPTRTNAALRVVELRRSWVSGRGERLRLTLGETKFDLGRQVANNKEVGDINVIRPQPSKQQLGLSGNGIYFDKDHFGVFSFDVPNGSRVDRVALKFQTLPWQATSKTASSDTAAPIPPISRADNDFSPDHWQEVSRYPHWMTATIPDTFQGGTYSGGLATAAIDAQTGATQNIDHQLTARPPGTAIDDDLDEATGNSALALTVGNDGVGGSGSPTGMDADFGPGWKTLGSGRRLATASDAAFDITGDLSLALVVDNQGGVTILRSFASGHTKFGLRLNSGKIEYFHDDSGGTEQTLTGSTTFAGSDERLRIYVRRDVSANAVKVVVNGVTEIDTTYTNDPSTSGTAAQMVIANEVDNNLGNSWAGRIYMLRGWSSAISESTLDAITDPNHANFDTYSNTLEGGEAWSYFFEENWVDGQVILRTDLDQQIGEFSGVVFNTDWDASVVQETWSVKSYVVGVAETTKDQNSPGSSGDYIGAVVASNRDANRNLMVLTKETHDHNVELEFGIFQFDGDGGDGTGAPVYGEGIKFAVDPTVGGDGLPSSFGSDRHPAKFGDEDGPRDVEFDVTSYLSVDANGVIESGPHRVYLQSEASTGSADGLAVVRVTPIIRYKEVHTDES